MSKKNQQNYNDIQITVMVVIPRAGNSGLQNGLYSFIVVKSETVANLIILSYLINNVKIFFFVTK